MYVCSKSVIQGPSGTLWIDSPLICSWKAVPSMHLEPIQCFQNNIHWKYTEVNFSNTSLDICTVQTDELLNICSGTCILYLAQCLMSYVTCYYFSCPPNTRPRLELNPVMAGNEGSGDGGGRRYPKSMDGLLKMCLETTKTEDAPNQTTVAPMSEEVRFISVSQCTTFLYYVLLYFRNRNIWSHMLTWKHMLKMVMKFGT